jgi:hypothetical protein
MTADLKRGVLALAADKTILGADETVPALTRRDD